VQHQIGVTYWNQKIDFNRKGTCPDATLIESVSC